MEPNTPAEYADEFPVVEPALAHAELHRVCHEWEPGVDDCINGKWFDELVPQIVVLLREREGLTFRVAELEGNRNQLRHVVDDQAHRIQSGLDRIAELEAERDALATAVKGTLSPDCNHGPGWQCVACVPDDGVSFQFYPLGPSNGGA